MCRCICLWRGDLCDENWNVYYLGNAAFEDIQSASNVRDALLSSKPVRVQPPANYVGAEWWLLIAIHADNQGTGEPVDAIAIELIDMLDPESPFVENYYPVSLDSSDLGPANYCINPAVLL